MKRECPQCGFELRTMSWYEGFIREKLDRFEATVPTGRNTTDFTGFDIWLETPVGTTLHLPELGDITLVEAQVNYDFEEESSLVYVVLRVGPEDSGSHYIQPGSRDSYGNATWDNVGFRGVTKQTRTTWIWQENT